MPIPILSSAARKALGRAIFRGLAPEGLSSSQMIRTADTLGYTYRREEMLADINKFTGRLKYETRIKALNVNDLVPRNWMSEVELDQPVNYRIHGTTTIWDEETGDYLEKPSSFYTNDYAKIGDWQQGFFNTYTGKYEEENLELTSFQVRAVEHFEGRPY